MQEPGRIPQIQEVAVIGAGTMGRGIAQTAALAGCGVALHDVNADLLASARGAIESSLERALRDSRIAPEDREGSLSRIRFVTDLNQAVRNADLVVEAIPEDLTLKKALFAELDRVCRPDTVLASNTSSLSITSLAEALTHPERVIGLHFFNPVDRMKLLEIVLGRNTGAETLAAARAAGERMGKTLIVVRDSPGFATSRLGIALGLEAIRMLEEGVAAAADIDTAMELGYRHPMGPLRLTDLVGLDVRLAIAEHLHEALGRETFRPPELLRTMVAEGKLGKKSGQGFYRWE